METFSTLLAICAGNSLVSSEFPAQRPVTRSFDVFCAWINGSVNHCEAGDLGCHHAHYDFTVMKGQISSHCDTEYEASMAFKSQGQGWNGGYCDMQYKAAMIF